MNSLSEFFEEMGDATEKLFDDISKACTELVEDLTPKKQKAKFLRLGGTVFCRENEEKHYAIVISSQSVLAINEGKAVECPLEEFVDSHDNKKLFVAAQKQIAVGGQAIARRAKLLTEKSYQNSEQFVIDCLEADQATVNDAIKNRFGKVEWQKYKISKENN